MDTQAPYQVLFIAEAPRPADLPYEAFCKEAVTRAWVAGVCFMACPSSCHFPAFADLPARTKYEVQVWNVANPARVLENGLGEHCFTVEANTTADCLALLTTKLAELVEAGYDADPSRHIDAQIEAFQALEAYA